MSPAYAGGENRAAIAMRHTLRAICFFGILFVGPGAWAQAADKPQDLEKAIREYILNNPDVIIEALERYEMRQREVREKAAKAALALHRNILLNHPMTPVSGAKNADVTIVEFFDYQCGFCKRTLHSLLEVLKEDKKVRVIWKEMPILGPTSEYAARAAMAAERQNKYFEFHTKVMGARGQLTPQKVLRLAGDVGLDLDRLKRDMADPKITRYLADTAQLAQALGITGTPGFVIGDQVVAGAIDKNKIQQIIAEIRNHS